MPACHPAITAVVRAALLVLGAVVCGACTGDVDDVGGWVALEDLGVLGFLPDDDGGEVYLCGTGEQVALSQWLSTDDGGLSFASADGDWTLARAGEEIVLEGPQTTWAETLTPFAEDGGLYEASPEPCRSGAVLHSGALSGTWCSGAGIFRQVEPVDTFTGAPLTIEVRLLDDAAYTFSLQRLR